LRQKKLRHLPLVDAAGTVVDLVTLDDLIEPEDELPVSAVVMAGGFGSRLQPLTDTVPKPLLPIGDQPLIERTIEQLRDAGIQRVYLATHYKSEAFAQHFGSGEGFGVNIEYVDEERPLGTAGALGKLNGTREPLLVINGDIVTSLNYRAMLAFHRENRAQMTVGVRQFEFDVPYGVVATEGVEISGIAEKPTRRMFINAGIYLLEPEVCSLVPQDRRFDMPDLITALIAEGKRVVAFPISEYWIDIGYPEDYEKARADAAKGTSAI
jgi:NDP-sugar pyrophosphorylase family protein